MFMIRYYEGKIAYYYDSDNQEWNLDYAGLFNNVKDAVKALREFIAGELPDIEFTGGMIPRLRW